MSITILVCGLWHLYNFLSIRFSLPYVELFENNILRAINIVVLKWSLILGLLYIIMSIFFLVSGRNNTIETEKTKIALFVISILTSICLLF